MKALAKPVSNRSVFCNSLSSKIIVICIIVTASQISYARSELPFCPSGGPPGWMNYFDYKRDQKIWRRQNHLLHIYRSSVYPDYNRLFINGPAYSTPYLQTPAMQTYNPPR